MESLAYPVVLEAAADGGFVVSFPDVPEAHTQGADKDEALARAIDACPSRKSRGTAAPIWVAYYNAV